MPGCFYIDEVNAKLCASVTGKFICPRLSAWELFFESVLFCKMWTFF